MSQIDDILGVGAIDRLRRPVGEARGLPGSAYTSAEFFELERKTLFPRTWMCIGFASDIPGPGDAMPLTAAGLPLVAVRGQDGAVRVFHNVCRHRAALIVTAPGKNLKQLACPYHAWAYGLDGALKATPWFDGTKDGTKHAIDKANYGLKAVRSAAWHHWIFVNLDGNAPAFAEHIRPLEDLLKGADLSAARISHREDWAWQGNWKLQPDNWETYHHIWVHKNIFTKMSDDLDLKTGEPKAEPLPLGTIMTLRRRAGTDFYPPANDLPYIPIPEGAERVRCTSVIFPNLTLTVQSDHLSSVVAIPIAPDRTVSQMGYFFVGEAATAPAYQKARDTVLDRWMGTTRRQGDRGGIRSQDMEVWEQQQIARRSPIADEVLFSPVWEKNVHHFQNMVVNVMAGANAPR
ncbi:MAG: aromatic ring-hydroxylating dioxygenase subunit alpha [Proteobacteria bacterium]|nr:aromatic ring-hydroxylating dioxygenase subunit alpha [Pseudomonadota bacterium]